MLEIHQLKKSYGDNEVLHGLDATFKRGQITGLVGKNGSGKTTLFHAILNFVSYTGQIRFDGQAISQETFARVGYLPEERSLMPKRTIREQISYLAALKGMSKNQVLEVLPKWMERLEVKGKIDDKIKSLSKGNQQKVQLMATLIHQPDLIILDEPFSGLDPVNTALLKEVILEERKRGACIIFSDHTMANVEEICDDLVMIADGEIAIQGSINEVRASYGRTRLFVSSEMSEDQLSQLPHVTQVTRTKAGTWRLVLDDQAAGPELFDLLTKGRYIQTFDQQAPTIDEIFKMIAGGQA